MTTIPPRTFRPPPGLWEQVRATAERRGETASDVIVRALRRYVTEDVDERARSVKCPLCRALPGDPCTWPDGASVAYLHPMRHEAAGQ